MEEQDRNYSLICAAAYSGRGKWSAEEEEQGLVKHADVGNASGLSSTRTAILHGYVMKKNAQSEGEAIRSWKLSRCGGILYTYISTLVKLHVWYVNVSQGRHCFIGTAVLILDVTACITCLHDGDSWFQWVGGRAIRDGGEGGMESTAGKKGHSKIFRIWPLQSS